MKKYILVTFFIVVSIGTMAYEWDSIGPTNVVVNNFNVISNNIEILCVDNGILIKEDGNWNSYGYGQMPALYAVGLDAENILVLLGDGSWSDGVYKFNLVTHQFEVVAWIPFPSFLLFCEYDNTYYLGGHDGMWKSTDGLNFDTIELFTSLPCWSFCYIENHYVVSTPDTLYFSDNAGLNWYPSTPGTPDMIDMAANQDHKLYGAVYGPAVVGGLYSSIDYGQTWTLETHGDYLMSIEIDSENNVFLGWLNDGVSHWDPELQLLTSFNDGLPDYNVKKLSTHTGNSSPNIVACTYSGANILLDYTVGVEETVVCENMNQLIIYPNPVKGSTAIEFKVAESFETKVIMYNSLGNISKVIYMGIPSAGKNNNVNIDVNDLSPGIYYCILKNKAGILAQKKMVIIQ